MENKQKSNRSNRTLPKNASALIASLADGTLDQRTKAAAQIIKARGVFNTAPYEASKAIICSALATWSVALGTIQGEISRCQSLLDGEKKLIPLLSELAIVEVHILKLSTALQALEHKATKPRSSTSRKAKSDDGSTIDISSLFADEVSS